MLLISHCQSHTLKEKENAVKNARTRRVAVLSVCVFESGRCCFQLQVLCFRGVWFLSCNLFQIFLVRNDDYTLKSVDMLLG